jgi:hypothetical protein
VKSSSKVVEELKHRKATLTEEVRFLMMSNCKSTQHTWQIVN